MIKPFRLSVSPPPAAFLESIPEIADGELMGSFLKPPVSNDNTRSTRKSTIYTVPVSFDKPTPRKLSVCYTEQPRLFVGSSNPIDKLIKQVDVELRSEAFTHQTFRFVIDMLDKYHQGS